MTISTKISKHSSVHCTNFAQNMIITVNVALRIFSSADIIFNYLLTYYQLDVDTDWVFMTFYLQTGGVGWLVVCGVYCCLTRKIWWLWPEDWWFLALADKIFEHYAWILWSCHPSPSALLTIVFVDLRFFLWLLRSLYIFDTRWWGSFLCLGLNRLQSPLLLCWLHVDSSSCTNLNLPLNLGWISPIPSSTLISCVLNTLWHRLGFESSLPFLLVGYTMDMCLNRVLSKVFEGLQSQIHLYFLVPSRIVVFYLPYIVIL